LDLLLPVQSVPITTKVVSSNPVHGVVYSIQHYVIKFFSDLRQVGGFLRVLTYENGP
jgi:predicted aconitase